MSKIERIKTLLEDCTAAEQTAILEYLKGRFAHPLETEWGVSSDIILTSIARSPDLTRRGVRGIIAEAVFVENILVPLADTGWNVTEFTGDQPYDFIIYDGDEHIRIQVKLQRTEKGVPKLASNRLFPNGDTYIVEVQKTRTGKNATTREDTRPYRFGEFDILAVCMHPSSRDWNKFMFTVADRLLPRPENQKLMKIMQPVPKEPNGSWTDEIETCIEWFQQQRKKE